MSSNSIGFVPSGCLSIDFDRRGRFGYGFALYGTLSGVFGAFSDALGQILGGWYGDGVVRSAGSGFGIVCWLDVQSVQGGVICALRGLYGKGCGRVNFLAGLFFLWGGSLFFVFFFAEFFLSDEDVGVGE